MNWRHLRAFVWLRWRLQANQWRRAGALSAALMIIISAFALIAVIPAFVGFLALGVYLIPKAEPVHLMFAWDALILAFLFFWTIGLVAELQKSDPLLLSKFLHLPVSVSGAFLINYLSSFFRLSLFVFGPVMLAYALALVYVEGFRQWAVLPSLAAFLLMVTAITYQFQGWLASLMSNPRRRRTVVVAATMTIILMSQTPNLVNLYASSQSTRRATDRNAAALAEQAELRRALGAKEIELPEFERRIKENEEKGKAEAKKASDEASARMVRSVRIGNMALPIGWLPMGVMAAAEGNVWPPLLGLAGMITIGSASLWWAFRTTIRQFQGVASGRKRRKPIAEGTSAAGSRGRLLEIRIPWVSEPVSAIALAGFRSLLRSPEAKLVLLSPIIMCVVFGSMLARGRNSVAEPFRPLVAIGGIAVVLLGFLQLIGNQFGMDRDGFRVFVLCAARRRDILLGKNLAFAPPALAMSALLLTVIFVLSPMRADHALAMAPQFVSMFLMFCSLANLNSIYAPVYIAPGTLKAANPKLTTSLLQLVMFLVLFPLFQGVTLLPLGIESAARALGWIDRAPVCLVLSLAECVAVFFLYRLSLEVLGDQLQARERKILETVTNRSA